MTVNLSAWRAGNHATEENDPEVEAAARVFLKAWAEGDAQTLYALAWPEFVAYHGDVLTALQSALAGMWKPSISEAALDSLVKKGKICVHSLPDGTIQKMMRIDAQLPSIYGDAFDAAYITLNLYETKDGWKADLTQLYERMNWDGQDEETEKIQRGLFFLVDEYLATCSAKALNYDAGENKTPSMYRTADADVRQAEETRLVAWEIGDAEKVLLDGEGMTFRVPCTLYACDERGFLLPVIRTGVSVEMTKNEDFRITGIGQ